DLKSRFPTFFFSSRRRHTRWPRDWSSDVCSSDLIAAKAGSRDPAGRPRTWWLGRKGSGHVAGRSIGAGFLFCPSSVRIARLECRSEERRVGKECRCGLLREHETKECEVSESG